MATKSIRVRAEYRETVPINNLSMEPSLQGQSVSFRFEGHSVEVTLPKLPEKKTTNREFIEAEADVWNKAGEIINVHIYAVCVKVGRLTFSLPNSAANHRSINATLYNVGQTKRLDDRSDKLYLLSRGVLDYWLQVVRWKTGFGLLGIDTRAENANQFGGRLYNLTHGGAFYMPRIPRTIVVPRRYRLSQNIWQEIAKALTKGEAPPIWNEYLMSAQQRIEVADLKAGILDLAIAAESAIKQFPHVPSTIRKKKRISELLRDWNQLGFPALQHLPWFADLNLLVKVRNQ
jgi:hypothetical protein